MEKVNKPWTFCPECGSKLKEDAKFCTKCGNKIGETNNLSQKTKKGLELKGISMWLMVPLYFINSYGFGILFTPLWFITQADGINSLDSEQKVNKASYGWALGLSFVALYFIALNGGETGDDYNTIGALALLGFLGIIIFYLIELFKVKNILEDHINKNIDKDTKLSGLGTWFFGITYLQAKINRYLK